MKKIHPTLPYEIYDDGRVYSIKSKMFIKPYEKDNHYLQYKLFNGKTYEFPYAHRLVASLFIENPNNYPCINHIDGNKQNNHISNLEWCTYSQNMQHAVRTKLYVKKRKYENLEPIYKDLLTGKYSPNDLANKYQYFIKSRLKDYLREYAKSIGELDIFEEAYKRALKCADNYARDKIIKPVIQLDLEGNFIKKFPSVSEAAKECNVLQGNISNVCAGRSKTCGGFKWVFA